MENTLLKKLEYALHKNRDFIKKGHEKNKKINNKLYSFIGFIAIFLFALCIVGLANKIAYLVAPIFLMGGFLFTLIISPIFLNFITKTNNYSIIHSYGWSSHYVPIESLLTIILKNSVYSVPDYERDAKRIMLSSELQKEISEWLTEKLAPAIVIRNNCPHEGKARGILTRLNDGEIWEIEDLDMIVYLFTEINEKPVAED